MDANAVIQQAIARRRAFARSERRLGPDHYVRGTSRHNPGVPAFERMLLAARDSDDLSLYGMLHPMRGWVGRSRERGYLANALLEAAGALLEPRRAIQPDEVIGWQTASMPTAYLQAAWAHFLEQTELADGGPMTVPVYNFATTLRRRLQAYPTAPGET